MKLNLYTLLISVGISFLIFNSCGSVNKSLTSEETIVWPSPPDTARIQYLMSFSNSLQIAGEQSWFSKIIFGVSGNKYIDKPYGITIKEAKVYICDQNKIDIIDFKKNTFSIFSPTGQGKLKHVLNSKFDEQGNYYIVDGDRKQVVIFDSEGNYLSSFGDTGLYKPTDIAITDNKIFVSNIKKNNVVVYDKNNYTVLFTIPDSTEADSESKMASPVNIEIANNLLYVSDIGASSVKIYTLDGKFIKSFGRSGMGYGSFSKNKGIAVDRDSIIYIVDAAFSNVQMFNSKGQVLMHFGGNYKQKGDMYLPANITIDYDYKEYFEKYVDPDFDIKFLIYVTNQYGPDKVSVYAFIEPSKASAQEKLKKKKKIKKDKDKSKKIKGKSLL